MKIVRSVADLPRYPTATVGFVPTMGAFHEGHLDLMRVAKTETDKVFVSLFVNPTQFGPNEDFRRYPRNEERDAEMAASVGVDVLFVPPVEEVYPRPSSIVSVPEVTAHWEGAHRPGHFDGVATVVAKLFGMVRPHIAYFGRKDLQQCAVIQRMVEDLHLPLQLRFVPTTREADGLAMSSRNAYLSPEQRAIAPRLNETLTRLSRSISEGADVASALVENRNALASDGFETDYLAYVDLATLEPLDRFQPASAVIVAARLGNTRLIDNVVIE